MIFLTIYTLQAYGMCTQNLETQVPPIRKREIALGLSQTHEYATHEGPTARLAISLMHLKISPSNCKLAGCICDKLDSVSKV